MNRAAPSTNNKDQGYGKKVVSKFCPDFLLEEILKSSTRDEPKQ